MHKLGPGRTSRALTGACTKLAREGEPVAVRRWAVAVRDGGLLLLTGAAGRVAARLRAPLRARYRLRLTDVRDLPDRHPPDNDLPGRGGSDDVEPLRPGESFVRGD